MTEATLPVLIEQMLQPGFYPHAVTEPIELIQTHVSYVLLTGDYAYKLKKTCEFWLFGLFHLREAAAFLSRRVAIKSERCW